MSIPAGPTNILPLFKLDSALADMSINQRSLTARFDPFALDGLSTHGSISGDDVRSGPSQVRDPQAALTRFIEHLLNPDHADTEPHLLAIGYELEALLSIYTPSSLKLCISSRPTSIMLPSPETETTPSISLHPAKSVPASIPMNPQSSQAWSDAKFDDHFGLSPNDRIRYEVMIPLWEVGEGLEGVGKDVLPDRAPKLRVLVSLPPSYPDSSPPQLQLLGRYLGDYSIDSGLFGDITRTYIASSGVPFTPGDVCVFEGLTHVQTLSRIWYTSRLTSQSEANTQRENTRSQTYPSTTLSVNPPALSEIDNESTTYPNRPSPSRATFSYTRAGTGETDGAQTPQAVRDVEANLPTNFEIFTSEAIVDRRSTFVGHAIGVSDEREVPLVIHELLGDKKIAKAAHPAIFAYRIRKEVGGAAGVVYNTDYDDDGETQAGARLKHLLEILELDNVLVVVSRWYGGTLLGPDRFKHINQAARDALELGGFLADKEKEGKGNGKKGKK